MLTTNKLTKTFASGIATISIAAVAGIFNVSSASAQVVLCYDGSASGLVGQTITCGDKIFQNFVFNGLPQQENGVEIVTNGAEWDFFYDFTAPISDGTYSISYDVDIIDPIQVFDLIELDSDTGIQEGISITKTITDSNTDALLLELESIDGERELGSIFEFNTKHISVLDEITIEDNAILESLSNGFTQRPHGVPEPGTILGLLAVGGLGLVSRFKKQK
jgi:hypothetical protein